MPKKDTIGILEQELPEVFNLKRLPESWDDEWIFLPINDSNESQGELDEAVGEPLIPENIDKVIQGNLTSASEALTKLPSEFSGDFAGGFQSYYAKVLCPPPDALAFYLPFHFFYPTWWGIYLIYEGVEWLATFLNEHGSEASLPKKDYERAARIFLFGHEQFHHEIESFATRLEITHRQAIYRESFTKEYQRTLGTSDCLEEGLANAFGLQKVLAAFPHPQDRDRLVGPLYEYFNLCGAGYNRGSEFSNKLAFSKGRNELAETYHRAALPSKKKTDQHVWNISPYGFMPLRNRDSRSNFLIHRDHMLDQRHRNSGLFARYREVERALKNKGCESVRQNGSHVVWKCPNGESFTVPRHPGDINQYIVKDVMDRLGSYMTVAQFLGR